MALETLNDAASALARLGSLDRDIQLVDLALKETVGRATKAADAKANPLREERDALAGELQDWARANRQEAKGKTIRLTTGKIAFRLGQAKLVGIPRDEAGRAAIVERLREALGRRAAKFIKRMEAPDTRALIDDAAAVAAAGLTIEAATETVTLSPASADVED